MSMLIDMQHADSDSGSDTIIIAIAVPSGIGVLILCCVLISIGVVVCQCAARGKLHHTQQRQRNGSQAWQTNSTIGLNLSAKNPIASNPPLAMDVPIASPISVNEKATIPLSSAASIRAHYSPISSLDKTTAFQSAKKTTPTLNTPHALEHITVDDPSLVSDAAAPVPTAPPLHSGSIPPLVSQVSGSGAAPVPPCESPPNYDHAHLYRTVLQ